MPTDSFRLLPDLANPTQKVCYGSRDVEDPNVVGVYELVMRREMGVESGGRCVTIYGGRSRDYVLDGWEKELELERVHLSGGWSNPMTAESNLMRRLSGKAELRTRTFGNVVEGLGDKIYRPPIFFNYPLAWQEMWGKKLREMSDRYLSDSINSVVTQTSDPNFEMVARKVLRPLSEIPIGDLLKLGAPTFWDTKAHDRIIAKSSSGPFTQAFAYGFFVSEDGVEFEGRKAKLIISNVTGARGIDTTGINLWLLHAVHGREETEDAYVASAEAIEADMKSKGKEAPWKSQDVRKLAKGFARTCEPVTELANRILNENPDADGFQLAMQVYYHSGLPIGVSKFPPTEPQAFVKEVTEDDGGIKHIEWKEVDILGLEA